MFEFIDQLIVALVVVAQILIVLYIVGLFLRRSHPDSEFVKTLGHNGFVLAFLAALAATLGSLYYSEIRGFEPCKFCWFQRIFMYPQVIMLGLALWRKEYWMKLYGIIFSVIGALIALNHYILQVSGTSILPCSAVGQSAACSKLFVMKLGYITIPLMAFTAFILMILALVSYRKADESNG